MEKDLSLNDTVFHDSMENFRITALDKRGGSVLVSFENDEKKVGCSALDMLYSVAREAWYMPGRLFNRATRVDMRASGVDVIKHEKHFMRNKQRREG